MSPADQPSPMHQVENGIRTGSRPTDLRITDIRLAVVASNYDYPIIRIDTNQGVYGLGEVRDAGHKENALQFKSMLLGQNPCNVDMIFRAMKHFGGWGREGGGVSGLEIALWDLVGKGVWRPLLPTPGRKISRPGSALCGHPRPQRTHRRWLPRSSHGPARFGAHLHQV